MRGGRRREQVDAATIGDWAAPAAACRASPEPLIRRGLSFGVVAWALLFAAPCDRARSGRV